MTILRQAVAADIPGIWEVRYSVTENTLTPGRISDQELLEAIEDTGRGWVIEDQGRIQAFAIGNAATGNIWALFLGLVILQILMWHMPAHAGFLRSYLTSSAPYAPTNCQPFLA